MLFFVSINYRAGIAIDHSNQTGENNKKRKPIFIAAILFNVLILCFFKYFNMIISLGEIFSTNKGNTRAILDALFKFDETSSFSLKHQIVLPLAISFTVFQTISYLADIYKGTIKAERNLLNYSLYIFFFPQLVQGPIMRYKDLGTQILSRNHSLNRFAYGVQRFSYGLAKKIIIADTLGLTANKIWAVPVLDLYTSEAWLGIILFTMQIYFDFSGYTDMAVGIGSMFGFIITENFNYPYTSLSVQEFWRRWHISLSSWFRDYIYIPLGGNRKGAFRTYLNLLIVFLVTGIWHGANLNFICWGLYFAVLNIIERLFLGNLLKKNPIKILNWMYCIFAVMMGWVLFRAPNLYHAVNYYHVLFRYVPEKVGTSIVSYFNADLLLALFGGVLTLGSLQRVLKKIYDSVDGTISFTVIRMVYGSALFMWSIMLLMNGTYNPSIYGNF